MQLLESPHSVHLLESPRHCSAIGITTQRAAIGIATVQMSQHDGNDWRQHAVIWNRRCAGAWFGIPEKRRRGEARGDGEGRREEEMRG